MKRDYVWWSFTANRTQKNMSKVVEWSRSLKTFEQRSPIREVLKRYLTEKLNVYSQSGRLREVVAYEKWCRYERVDWISDWGARALPSPQVLTARYSSAKTKKAKT